MKQTALKYATIEVLTSSLPIAPTMRVLDPKITSDPILDRLPSSLVSGLDLTPQNRVSIDRGRSIVADGHSLSALYLVAEGWGISRMSIGTGGVQILDILGPGSFIGLARLGDVGAEEYSAVASQKMSVFRIGVEQLRESCAQDENLSQWLFGILSRQSRQLQKHLTALGQLPARGRLAFAMLRILDVAQQTGQSAINQTIRLPMTQEEIGNMLGLTNVSISKLMSTFRKEGLIDYGRNRIVIHDVEALSEICGMKPEQIAH